MKRRFKDKVVVVTGAAQSIGLSCIKAFAAEGAQTVIADINADRADESAASLTDDGFSALSVAMDVRKPDDIEAAVQTILSRFGQIDVWINNAGVAHHYDSFDLPSDLWQLSIDVMLSGSFYGCQAAGRVMRDHGGGAIINMASVNGLVSNPRRASYNSVKAGLIMLTRSLAAEWAEHHIRVNAVAPSPTETSGMAEWGISQGMADDNIYVTRHPMKRMARLEDISSAALFLASDAASFITGETICVDGGWVAYGYL